MLNTQPYRKIGSARRYVCTKVGSAVEGVQVLSGIEFGKRVQAIRRAKGLTQADVGAALGLSEGGWRNYETGRAVLKINQLPVLANLLDCSIADLLGLGGDSSSSIRGALVRNAITEARNEGLRELSEAERRSVERLASAVVRVLREPGSEFMTLLKA